MTVPWDDDRWARIVQPSEPDLDSRHVQRSDGTHFPEPYGSMTPAHKATPERQLVCDNTGGRRRRFWPFQPNGRKMRRVMDPDERANFEFWSRRRRNN